MAKSSSRKKWIVMITILVLFIFILAGVSLCWKVPSRRETMSWARSLEASDISKIELVVMPSSEDERYRIYEEDDFDDIAALVNESTGRYIEAPEPLSGMSRTLYITTKDGVRHTVEYNGYLVIDGDAYADHFCGYSQDGESLGYGNSKMPDRFED